MEAAKYLFIPNIPKILIWVLHSVSCSPDDLFLSGSTHNLRGYLFSKHLSSSNPSLFLKIHTFYSSWKRHWCWNRLKVGAEGDDRGWDGWMASLTSSTWIWVNSKLGDVDGQGGLICCSSWGRKESDMTEQLNWTDWLTHLTPVRIAIIKKSTKKSLKLTNAREGMEKRECSYALAGNVNWCSHYGEQ